MFCSLIGYVNVDGKHRVDLFTGEMRICPQVGVSFAALLYIVDPYSHLPPRAELAARSGPAVLAREIGSLRQPNGRFAGPGSQL